MSDSTILSPQPPAPRRRQRIRSWLSAASASAVVVGFAITATGWSATAQASPPPTWQRQVTPGPAGSGFRGISCTSSTACVGVGGVWNGSRFTALAETETAGTWKVDAVPQPSPHADSELWSVSCPSPIACVAVGLTNASGRTEPFSEVLTATTWRILPTARLRVAGAQLDSVSCASADACTAVGSWWPASGNNGTLAEVYNGHAWLADWTPVLGGWGSLSGVSCLRATVPALCTAVGGITVGSKTSPLVEHANGYHWTVQAVPTVPSSSDTSLASISCPQPTSCVAVGSALEGSYFRSVSEVENLLHWTMVATPRVPVAQVSDNLLGVSCPLSTDSCRAVGFYGNAGTFSLAEAWNGHSWALQTAATPPSNLAELLGVSCTTVHLNGVACTAAGEYQDNPMGSSHTLAERN